MSDQVTFQQLLTKIGQMTVQIDFLTSVIEQLKTENEGLKKAALEESGEQESAKEK